MGMEKLIQITKRLRLAIVAICGLSAVLMGCPPTETLPPTFSLELNKTAVTIKQGEEGTVTITVSPENGFSDSVNLSVLRLPVNVTPVFSENPTSLSSQLTLQVTNSAAVNTTNITIRGESGNLEATANLSLTVEPGDSTKTFSIFLNPNELTIIKGEQEQTTVTLDFVEASEPVNLSVENLPSGVSASFSQTPTTTSSILTLTVDESAEAGASLITVKGTLNGSVVTTALALGIEDRPVPGKGNLQVIFSGLPGTLADEGYITIKGPNSYSKKLFSETTLTGLEPGDYLITVDPIYICGREYISDIPEISKLIVENEIQELRINYAVNNELSPAFRAKVSSTYSDGSTLDAEATFVLDTSGSENILQVYGCITDSSSHDIDMQGVRILEGNAKNHFLSQGSFFRDVQFTDEVISGCIEVDFSCKVSYVKDELILTDEEVTKLNNDDYYIVLEPRNSFVELVGQISLDDSINEQYRGGDLEITIDTTGIYRDETSWSGSVIQGIFDFSSGTIYAGYTDCSNKYYLTQYMSEDQTFADIFAGEYLISVSSVYRPSSSDLLFVPKESCITVNVQVGQKTTVDIEFEPQGWGFLNINLSGIPTDEEAHITLRPLDEPNFYYREDGSYGDYYLAGTYEILADNIITFEGEVYTPTIDVPSPVITSGGTTNVEISYTKQN